jgi:hypothetical protein
MRHARRAVLSLILALGVAANSSSAQSRIVGTVYDSRFGTIPSQFDRVNGCGSVVVWTKW